MSLHYLEVHPLAIKEANTAFRYYRKRNAEVAQRFLSALKAGFQRLLDKPDLQPPYILNTRFLKIRRFPYLMIFQISGALVRVLAVPHGRRKPGYWKKRLAP